MEPPHRHHLDGGPARPVIYQASSYASGTLGNTPTCTYKYPSALKGSSETKNALLGRGERGSQELAPGHNLPRYTHPFSCTVTGQQLVSLTLP